MPQPDPTARATILVVEDEAFIRMDLVDFFEDAGFTVLEAEGADEAVALLADHPAVEALLTDINMPGSMDGIRLAHYVHDRYPPTILVVTSGATRPSAEELPCGARFMQKPFDPRAVLGFIQEAH